MIAKMYIALCDICEFKTLPKALYGTAEEELDHHMVIYHSED